jgi:hypothetical protein
VGEPLKYLAWASGQPIACLAWRSAPRHRGSRDRYLGWSAQAPRANLRCIAYNTRFLILPWVLDEARPGPLSEDDYPTLQTTLHAWIARWRANSPRSEKMMSA